MKIKVRYQDGSEGIEELRSAEEELDRLTKHANEVAKIFKDCIGRDPNPKEIQVIFDLLTNRYDHREPEIVTIIGW